MDESRYQCPGEAYTITREDHRARLASFYAGCAACPHRDDTAHLSARTRTRLDEAHRRGTSRGELDREGVGGVAWNDYTPERAGQWARAFGLVLRDVSPEPAVLLASDGRELAPEFVASAATGLRWAGCHVIDLGASTAACLAATAAREQTAGGVLVANPHELRAGVGLKFWGRDAIPMSAGGALEAVQQRLVDGLDRPQRCARPSRRIQAESAYLEPLRAYFHGLRPLAIAVQTTCMPLVNLLARLLESSECRLSANPPLPNAGRSAFSLAIDSDGQSCRVFDELGREAAPARVAALLAKRCRRDAEDFEHVDLAGLVTCEDIWRRLASRRLLAGGAQTCFAADDAGRYWFADPGQPPLADALRVFALLVSLLSESDQPLSARLAAPSGG